MSTWMCVRVCDLHTRRQTGVKALFIVKQRHEAVGISVVTAIMQLAGEAGWRRVGDTCWSSDGVGG